MHSRSTSSSGHLLCNPLWGREQSPYRRTPPHSFFFKAIRPAVLRLVGHFFASKVGNAFFFLRDSVDDSAVEDDEVPSYLVNLTKSSVLDAAIVPACRGLREHEQCGDDGVGCKR